MVPDISCQLAHCFEASPFMTPLDASVDEQVPQRAWVRMPDRRHAHGRARIEMERHAPELAAHLEQAYDISTFLVVPPFVDVVPRLQYRSLDGSPHDHYMQRLAVHLPNALVEVARQNPRYSFASPAVPSAVR